MRFGSYPSSTATNGPVVVRFDDLLVRPIGGGATPPPVDPPVVPLAVDGFTRTATNGWGSADTGGAWSPAAGVNRFSVANGAGVQAIPAGVRAATTLNGVSSTAIDLTTKLSLDALPDGAVSASVVGRAVGAAEYAARVRVQPTGVVDLHVERSGTALVGGTLPGVILTAGLQAAGAVRLSTYLSSATTNGPLTVRFDDLRAVRIP